MADVSYVAKMIDEIEASEQLGPEFVNRCHVRVLVEGDGRTHRKAGAHVQNAERRQLTLAQLRACTSLCAICWQSARLKGTIQNRWAHGVPPDGCTDLLGDAHALVGLFEQASTIERRLALRLVDAELVKQIARLERGMRRVLRRADDPILGPLTTQLAEKIGGLETDLTTACPESALEHWALGLLRDPAGHDADRTPTVLAISQAVLMGQDASMAELAISHYEVTHHTPTRQVLVAPRFVVDTLLIAMASYGACRTRPKVSTRPLSDPIEVIETAAGLWDPGSDGPLASFSEALAMARSVLHAGPIPNQVVTTTEAPSS